MSRSTESDVPPPATLSAPAPDAAPSLIPAPPAVPRPITRAARRRSWAEPQVRVWWLCALLLLATIFYFTVSQIYDWSRETHVIRNGQVIDAVILGPEVDSIKNSRYDPSRPLYLRFEFRGHTYTVHGLLPSRNDWYISQTTLSIHIDPENPDNWTANTEIASLSSQLLVGKLLLPLVAVLFAGAWLKRRSVLKLWQIGEAIEAIVTQTHAAANAPLSRLARCTLKKYGRTEETYDVILPSRPSRAAPGDELWLILPTGRTRALAAKLYE